MYHFGSRGSCCALPCVGSPCAHPILPSPSSDGPRLAPSAGDASYSVLAPFKSSSRRFGEVMFWNSVCQETYSRRSRRRGWPSARHPGWSPARQHVQEGRGRRAPSFACGLFSLQGLVTLGRGHARQDEDLSWPWTCCRRLQRAARRARPSPPTSRTTQPKEPESSQKTAAQTANAVEVTARMRAKTGVSSVKPVRDRLQAPQRPSRTTTRRRATSLVPSGRKPNETGGFVNSDCLVGPLSWLSLEGLRRLK